MEIHKLIHIELCMHFKLFIVTTKACDIFDCPQQVEYTKTQVTYTLSNRSNNYKNLSDDANHKMIFLEENMPQGFIASQILDIYFLFHIYKSRQNLHFQLFLMYIRLKNKRLLLLRPWYELYSIEIRNFNNINVRMLIFA